uniref:Spike glycoprotein n=1 Tax=Bat Coronavirus PaGZ19 TaxID=3018872 RepID=A0AA49IA35_9NIDO|nr:spike glycoprotein [Bat Coronavirus PaGZ19]
MRLGLPPNTTSYVAGYLPTPGNWSCGANDRVVYYKGVHGVFIRYFRFAGEWSIGVGPSTLAGTQDFGLFLGAVQNQYLTIRICRWPRDQPAGLPSGSSAFDCIFNKQIVYTLAHEGGQVIGLSWTGNAVTVHGAQQLYRLYVPTAEKWNSVSISCQYAASCGHQVIYKPITAIATTNDKGWITSYSVCNNCSGFPGHVFAVGDGGKIPESFSFTNRIFLINSSSSLQGRRSAIHTHTVHCLCPIPALTPAQGVIYFNSNNTHQKRCSGFDEHDVAEYERLCIYANSTVQIGVLSLLASTNSYYFSCSNNSDIHVNTQRIGIPFGKTYQPYYCFVVQGYDVAANRSFVGIMPSDVREIVVSASGSVYINGFRLFTVQPLIGVKLNFSSLTGSDFWTVAYTSNTHVLVDLQHTYITGILYCDNPLNRLKCQHQQFFMEDGFYSAAEVAAPVAQTVVMLPEYSGLTNITLQIDVAWERNGACIQCEPQSKNVTLNGDPRGSVCVEANRFTVNTIVNANSPAYRVGPKTGNCPFYWYNIDKYLRFGSICFSLVDNGGCTMPIVAINYINIEYSIGVLYVTHTPGDAIVGVPSSFSERLGYLDASVVHLNVCTEYNIYGIVGKGVINEINETYSTGIVYTDVGGALVSFKNTTSGKVYGVRPCQTFMQYAVVSDNIVGVISASTEVGIPFNHTIDTPMFYYSTNTDRNCTDPVLTYASMGICSDGAIGYVQPRVVSSPPFSPIVTGNVTVPVNFTVSVQAEYVQVSLRAVVVDCPTYVCNGNVRCIQLLQQYVTACTSVESALAMNARLESQEVNDMLAVDYAAYQSALQYNVDSFENDFNITNVMPAGDGKGSFIEDLLFDKVITNGLGTVDADYKKCLEDNGNRLGADTICRQFYNGISVLPALTDNNRLSLYSASLMGGITLGAFGAGLAALPFSLSVFSKMNYLALQTDFIQENQKILAAAFNNAMGNITNAFSDVNNALQQTSDAIKTVASALNKVQDAVNNQGEALQKLTSQLSMNFDAISSSIEDIYNRLDDLAADAQVDRLINGRLAALSSFTAAQLVKYSEVRQSRAVAMQKVNECVKSQSSRLGFCGNGTHLFSMVVGAPEGLMFLHTVLLPTEYREVAAWAGICVGDRAYVLREPQQVLFRFNETFYVTPRNMYQPRVPVMADFVQIQSCAVTYVNLTSTEFENLVPDFIDVNKTLEDFISKLPNYTYPELDLGVYNHTFLNLTEQISTLENRSAELELIAERLKQHIDNINNTLVDLEWLDRLETYIKWPWYVWLAIAVVFVLLLAGLLWCCIATGCCGCCGCLAASCAGCCDCQGKKLQRYEVEKVHIQ